LQLRGIRDRRMRESKPGFRWSHKGDGFGKIGAERFGGVGRRRGGEYGSNSKMSYGANSGVRLSNHKKDRHDRSAWKGGKNKLLEWRAGRLLREFRVGYATGSREKDTNGH